LLIGCGETEQAQSWQLDRIRLLAARGEVAGPPDPVLGTRAEPRPGETLRFSSLSYAPPDDPIAGALWIGCLTEGDTQTGCEFDESAFDDLESLDESASAAEIEEAFQRLNEAGFLGIEPDWPPMWVVPDDALEGVEDRLEGVSAFVNISLLPMDESALEDDEADLEAGFKRVAVSEATSPNHNPDIKDIVVAGTSIEDARGFTARAGLTYILDPILEDGHIETYSYITGAGEEELREEEPYFSWYTELGSEKTSKQAGFDTDYSLYPYSSVEWTAPKVSGTIRIHVVVRDRRGGMGWRSLVVNVL
jgi:hypothetical protein